MTAANRIPLADNNLETQGLTIPSGQLKIELSGRPGVGSRERSWARPGVLTVVRPALSLSGTCSELDTTTHCSRPGYLQNFHHAFPLAAGAAARAVCISIRRSSSFAWCATANSARRTSIRLSCSALWAVPFRPGTASPAFSTSINHLLPVLCPVSNPLVKRRLTVFWDTPRAIAASGIDKSITSTVTHLGKRLGRRVNHV